MGRTICETHGRQAIAQACEHVMDAFQARAPAVPCREVVVADQEVEVLGVWLCRPCEHGLGIQPTGRADLGATEAETLLDSAHAWACRACFEKWLFE